MWLPSHQFLHFQQQNVSRLKALWYPVWPQLTNQRLWCVLSATPPLLRPVDWKCTPTAFTWRTTHTLVKSVGFRKGLQPKSVILTTWTCITTSRCTGVQSVPDCSHLRLICENTFMIILATNKEEEMRKTWLLQYVCLAWYDLRVWLGVKNQCIYLATVCGFVLLLLVIWGMYGPSCKLGWGFGKPCVVKTESFNFLPWINLCILT